MMGRRGIFDGKQAAKRRENTAIGVVKQQGRKRKKMEDLEMKKRGKADCEAEGFFARKRLSESV